jgi:arylsulfatase A-like enzyme
MSLAPNVLFVITDQQRADHTGFAGNPVVRTPHLDALAARGTVFERCYVANPICMPNRASIVTGRMPSVHTVVFNDRSLPWSANTFVRRLREAGYRTGLLGKSHFQAGMSRNTERPSPGGPATYDPYPEGWDHFEDPGRYEEGPVELPDDFYGFDRVELCIDHGGVASGHHLQWALAQGGDRERLLGGNAPDGPARWRSKHWWQIYQPDLPEELYSTRFVTERTIDFVTEATREGRPWFAWCSFPDPHHPLTPPGRWFERHAAEDMELPATFRDPLEGAPGFMHVLRGLAPSDDPERYVFPFGPDADQVREAIAATYGMIEMIDDGVGRILAAIEALESERDTVVVFTSDHGDMMGDHGLIMKLLYHYQGCVRVPLVIADPRRQPGRTRSLASSVDLAQTVLELCGLESWIDMQGHSLVPLLDEPKASVRDAVLVEEDFPLARRRGPIPHRARSVITDDGRITRYSSGEGQLFDLATDPDEIRDLWRDPAAADRRAALFERLAVELMAADAMARPEPGPIAEVPGGR